MSELILEIVEGPEAGRRIPFVGDFDVGRAPDNQLALQDELVSRRHARISPVEGGVMVEDLNSSNGTFVNHNQIHSPTLMTPGDQLLVGVTVMELRSPAQVRERPTAVRQLPPALAQPPRSPDYLLPSSGAGPAVSPLDPLLDVRAKGKARLAPLAVFVLAVIVVVIYVVVVGGAR